MKASQLGERRRGIAVQFLSDESRLSGLSLMDALRDLR